MSVLASLVWCVVLVYALWLALSSRWWRMLRCSARTHTLSGALPLLGHAHKLLQDNIKLADYIREISEETEINGGVAKIWIGPLPYFIITNPEDALTLSNISLEKNYMYRFVSSWIGEGLTLQEPLKWRRHRKLLNPAFNQNVLNGFLDIFNQKAARMVDSLACKAGKGEFEHWPFIKESSLETICHTAFGLSSDDEKVIDEDYREAVQTMLRVFMERLTHIWMHFDWLYKWTHIKEEEDLAVDILKKKSLNLLQQHKANLRNSIKGSKTEDKATENGKFGTILEFLLRDEGSLTDLEIREQIDTIILAGNETSATELNYTFFLLGSHPQVQNKIYEELKEVLGDSNRDVTKDDLPKLIYLEAVIKESLRMYPGLPVVLRNVDKDVHLKNHVVPSGAGAVISIWGLNYSKAWGPDAQVFRPERWLDSRSLPQHPACFATFSLGKRGCLGKTYALMSMKTTLAHLVRRYRLKADGKKLQLKLEVLAKPASDCKVSLELR